MVKLYVVRHGETDSNIRQSCIGQKDVPLNDNGRLQAEALSDRLKDVGFDAAYTSPLQRAADTLWEVLKKQRDVRVVQSYDLIERDYGIFDDMTYREIAEKYPAEFDEWKSDWIYYKIPEGESSAEVQERVNRALDKIIETEDGKTVLIVTHLGAARQIISHALDLTIEDSWHFALDNARAAVLEIDKDRRLLTGLNI
ncbi:MAG: histidine phosphatase family protein [Firmicutes bacterium]|nr:histidine phosphatase family protein [Bacillota bacterium]